MSPTTDCSRGAPLQDVDVLIVGAGSSGTGAARRLRQRTPRSSYAIVEAGRSVANGRELPARIPDRASESGAEEYIAYSTRVLRASWSGDPAHWIVTLQDCESGALATMSCSFLYLCLSHHGYVEGHTPAWPALIREYEVKRLPESSGFDRRCVQTYEPWDQRIDVIPDGDFLDARQSGRADSMTDRIGSFTETGLGLRSGWTLDADVIVTPTGLKLRNVGGIELTVDGAPVEVPQYVLYRGMMLDGVPNLVFALGSSDAPWTLTTDLVSDHVARLVAHMEERGYTAVTARLPSQPTETSTVGDMTSGQFQPLGGAPLSQGERTLRRRHGRSCNDSALFRRSVAARELEFKPADV